MQVVCVRSGNNVVAIKFQEIYLDDNGDKRVSDYPHSVIAIGEDGNEIVVAEGIKAYCKWVIDRVFYALSDNKKICDITFSRFRRWEAKKESDSYEGDRDDRAVVDTRFGNVSNVGNVAGT